MNAVESFLDALGTKTAQAVERLDALVTLTIGPAAAQTFEGQVILLTSARLLTRLYRNVRLVVPDVPLLLPVPGVSLTDGVIRWADGVPVVGETCEGQVLAVGDASGVAHGVFVSASGWRVRLSSHAPIHLRSQGDGNPVGAVAAAALGTAEVFKRVTLSATSTPHVLAEDVDLSTYDFRADGTGANPLLPEHLDLGEIVQFGVGSVGSASLYTLQFLTRLRGALDLVDDDRKLSDRNPARYVHAALTDVHAFQGRAKVRWAEETLQGMLPHVRVNGFPVDVRAYTAQRDVTRPIGVAVSAVDSIPSRQDIVDALPRRVVNAATGRTRVNLTRHGFNDGHACLMCDYVQRDVTQREPVQHYAEMTGLPLGRIVALLQERQPLAAADLSVMVQAGRLPAERASSYEGQPFEDLIKDGALYAAATVQSEGRDRVVTLAFVSAFSGALLAGELLKEVIPELARNWVGNHYEQDLLYLPNDMRLTRAQQDASVGTCLCHHYARRRFHARLHARPPAPISNPS